MYPEMLSNEKKLSCPLAETCGHVMLVVECITSPRITTIVGRDPGPVLDAHAVPLLREIWPLEIEPS